MADPLPPPPPPPPPPPAASAASAAASASGVCVGREALHSALSDYLRSLHGLPWTDLDLDGHLDAPATSRPTASPAGTARSTAAAVTAAAAAAVEASESTAASTGAGTTIDAIPLLEALERTFGSSSCSVSSFGCAVPAAAAASAESESESAAAAPAGKAKGGTQKKANSNFDTNKGSNSNSNSNSNPSSTAHEEPSSRSQQQASAQTHLIASLFGRAATLERRLQTARRGDLDGGGSNDTDNVPQRRSETEEEEVGTVAAVAALMDRSGRNAAQHRKLVETSLRATAEARRLLRELDGDAAGAVAAVEKSSGPRKGSYGRKRSRESVAAADEEDEDDDDDDDEGVMVAGDSDDEDNDVDDAAASSTVSDPKTPSAKPSPAAKGGGISGGAKEDSNTRESIAALVAALASSSNAKRAASSEKNEKPKKKQKKMVSAPASSSSSAAAASSSSTRSRSRSRSRKEENQTWDDMYAQLQHYHSGYGHCRVPYRQNNVWNPLGGWVRHMRDAYRDYTNGACPLQPDNDESESSNEAAELSNAKAKAKAPPKTQLTQGRIAKLEALGFQWSLTVEWTTRLEQLQTYRSEHGHCRVPRSYQPSNKLGEFCHNQRQRYREAVRSHGKTAANATEWATQLRNVGFVFQVKAKKQSWEQRFESLLEYRRANGHLDVYANVSDDVAKGRDKAKVDAYEKERVGDASKASVSLLQWANYQRFEYSKLVRGKKSTMTKTKLKRLQDIGFPFQEVDASGTNAKGGSARKGKKEVDASGTNAKGGSARKSGGGRKSASSKDADDSGSDDDDSDSDEEGCVNASENQQQSYYYGHHI